MSDGSGKVAFVWGDGEEHAFRLGLAQLRELQSKTDCGPYALLRRIQAGDWKVDDLRQTIRLGLIGGGHEPGKAAELMKLHVDARPWLESVAPAILILMAALTGPDEDGPAKKAGAGETASATNSPSPA